GAPVGFQGGGFEGLGEAVEAGLGSGVAHGGMANENGIPKGCRQVDWGRDASILPASSCGPEHMLGFGAFLPPVHVL
ncbi:MAG TPA: hypothetical protein VIP31_10425, partial [Acidovorax sp.]